MLPKAFSGLMLLLFITADVFPQLNEFIITPQPAPAVIPVFTSHPDKAAIIIYSSVDNITFDSNTDGIVKIMTDEISGTYTLIVYPERQFIKVKKRGFLEGLINIPPIETRQVLYYKIEQKINTEVEYGNISVVSDPPGASFTIKGIPGAVYKTPASLSDFRSGTYEFTFSLADHVKTDTVVAIDKNKNNEIRINMKAEYGFLRISNPDSGEVSVNGSVVNPSEYSGFRRVSPGKYEVKIKHRFFHERHQEREIIPSYPPDSIDIDGKLDPIVCKLNITSEPKGAEVFANGKLLGVTPLISDVIAGEYTFEIRYPSFTKKILKETIINPSHEYKVELLQNSAFVFGGTPGTGITVNSKFIGRLPMDLPVEVENGKHLIIAELEGYDPVLLELTMNKETRNIEFDMVKSEGRLIRFSYPGSYRADILVKNHFIGAETGMMNFSKNLFTTAANYPVYFDGSSVMYGGEYRFSYYFISLRAGYLQGKVSTTLGNTFSAADALFDVKMIRGGIEVSPVMFFEKLTPYAGIEYYILNLNYDPYKFAEVYNDYLVTDPGKQEFTYKNLLVNLGIFYDLKVFNFLNFRIRLNAGIGLGGGLPSTLGISTGFSF